MGKGARHDTQPVHQNKDGTVSVNILAKPGARQNAITGKSIIMLLFFGIDRSKSHSCVTISVVVTLDLLRTFSDTFKEYISEPPYSFFD